MSSIDLLDKTRMINGLLRRDIKERMDFGDVCDVLSKAISSSVCVLSAKGKVLGKSERSFYPKAFSAEVGRFIDDSLNDRLLGILSTGDNLSLARIGIQDPGVQETKVLVSPVDSGRDRIGTLIVFRREREFSVDDIILCEAASAVVSLEMLRSLMNEEASVSRARSDASAAFAALSSTEKLAVLKVFDELSDNKGVVVASRISKKEDITRSVIVNALKKLDSAGIIISRSAGAKGTYVEVINRDIYDLLQKDTV